MEFRKIYEVLNEIAPFDTQENWDNSGVQVKIDEFKDIKKVLLTLDLTRDVLDEAIDNKVDLIITHHPLFFDSIKSIDSKSLVYDLIKKDISMISLHTNFDKVLGGNNDYYGKLLGFDDLEGEGFFRIYKTKEKTNLEDILNIVKSINQEEVIFYTGSLNREISKVGFCVGSGADFLDRAINSGCDCYITGDVKYHVWQYANDNNICLINGTHFHMEKNFSDNFYNILINKIGDSIEILKTERLEPPYKFI